MDNKNSFVENELPGHPGELLLNEFMTPMKISGRQVAKALNVTHPRIVEIIKGRRRITAETAIRLARLFGTSARFWLELQLSYDLKVAHAKLGPQIEQTVQPLIEPRLGTIRLPDGKDKPERRGRDSKPLPEHLGTERTVFDALTDEPTHFDVLMQKTGLEVGELSAALTSLELDGFVQRRPGDWYLRAK